jgi:nitroreductase
MDALEAMRTARSIRRFTTDPVPFDVLGRCLEAATWAPSGGNLQRWRFIALQSDEARAALAEGAAVSWDVSKDLYGLDAIDPDDQSRWARNARAVAEIHANATHVPAAVVFTVEPHPSTPPLLQGASIFPAMENFLIAARAEGLGAVVTGWGSTGGTALRSALRIPDEWEIAALVVVGWPRGRHGPVRRRPVRQVAFLDGWDQPYPYPVAET